MHTLHFARYFAPLADISNQIPPPGAGSPMLLMILAILSFPLFILVLVRRKDAKIVESAQKDGRNIFKITFSPSFLRSQRYSGVGFIEVFNDYITISGRRKWPLKKNVIGFFAVALLLSVFAHLLGPLGALFLSTLFFRNRVEDRYSLARIDSMTHEVPSRYLIFLNKTNEDQKCKIEFQSTDFNRAYRQISTHLYEKISTQLTSRREPSEAELEFAPAHLKYTPINLEQSKQSVRISQINNQTEVQYKREISDLKRAKLKLIIITTAAVTISIFALLLALNTPRQARNSSHFTVSGVTSASGEIIKQSKQEPREKEELRHIFPDKFKEWDKIMDKSDELIKEPASEKESIILTANEDYDSESIPARIEQRNQLLLVTPLQQIQSKINILQGERWEFPIQIGDRRDHVYLVLGNPTDNQDSIVAAHKHFNKQFASESDDTQFWSDAGILINFEKNKVVSIEVQAGETWLNKPYTSPVAYGVEAADTLPVLYSKLGTPHAPKSGDESKWGSQKTFEWRIGKLRITRSIITKKQTEKGRIYNKGDNWGGLCIEDLGPIVHAEKQNTKDKGLRAEKISISDRKLTAKEIFRKYSDRIFIVTSYDSLGKPITEATAVLYRKGIYLTNYHVIKHARKVTIKSIHTESEEVEVLAKLVDKSHDWAVLDTVVDFSGKRTSPEYPEIHTATIVEPGEELVVIGNPKGFVGTVTTGIMSAVRTAEGVSWIQISAPISEGSSGSPVFNETGHLIGLATSSLKNTQNLNLATPIDQIVKKIHIEDEKKKEYFKDKSEFESALASRAGLGKGFKTIRFPLNGILRDDKRYQEILNKNRVAIRSDNSKLKQECVGDLIALTTEYPDPEDEDTLLGEAEEILLDLKNYPDLDKIVARRIAINPNNYKGYLGTALLFQRTRRIDAAKSYFEKAISLAQNDIQRDFDSINKEYEKDSFEGEPEYRKQSRKENYAEAVRNVAFQHAEDALSVGKMYFEISDKKSSRKWFAKAVSWAPILSEEAEPYLRRLNESP